MEWVTSLCVLYSCSFASTTVEVCHSFWDQRSGDAWYTCLSISHTGRCVRSIFCEALLKGSEHRGRWVIISYISINQRDGDDLILGMAVVEGNSVRGRLHYSSTQFSLQLECRRCINLWAAIPLTNCSTPSKYFIY